MREKYVLFVDDEVNVLKSLQRSLHKWLASQNLKFLKAMTAQETIGILQQKGSDIAVVVTDQKMPYILGSELSRVISKKYPDIALIILSGHTDMKDLRDIVQSGVVSFLTKPWVAEDLQDEILKALSIYNLRREVRRSREKEEEELRLAAEFQKSILKVSLPKTDEISMAVTYKPVSHMGVGGDYYDVIPLDSRRFAVLTGDVSGHGLKTSFLTAILKSLILPGYISRADQKGGFSPAEFLTWLNSRLFEFLKDFPELFIAFTAVLIDLTRPSFTFSNAGQPPLFLLKGSHLHKLDHNNLVLGIEEKSDYKENTVLLEGGERILLYTDAVYPSGSGAGHYEEEHFRQVLLKHGKDWHDHKALLADFEQAMAPQSIDDDITLLSVMIHPKMPSPAQGRPGA